MAGTRIGLIGLGKMGPHGSVVRTWLLELIGEILDDGASLGDIAPIVADSGEGRNQ